MKRAAYVRVSTPEQDPERQRSTIEREYEVDEWFADVEHGDVMTGRSGFNELVGRYDEFDEVVMDESSRIGRTIAVRDTVSEMREHGITVRFIDGGYVIPPADEEMDLETGIWWDVTTRFAKEEHRQLKRRTREGIRRAKEAGKHVGEPPTGFVVTDGFLEPADGEYERVSEFVREVNKGRPKKPTAEFFGFNPNSANSILKTTQNEEYAYENRYVGDEVWRERRLELRNGDREVAELGQAEG